MAYYLAVEAEKDQYNALKIKNCRSYHGNAYRYEGPYECTLREINNITLTYVDEHELKEALLCVYALKEEELDKSLVIFYKEGPEVRKLRGKVLYEESRELLENPNLVIKYIELRANEYDYTFFKELAKTLPNDSISRSLILKIASLLEKSEVADSREPELDALNSLGNNIVQETARLLIYNTNINNEGLISATNTVNDEKIHDLVSFINDYKKALEKDKTNSHKKVKENTSN